MVHRTRPGLRRPEEAFDQLRPAFKQVARLQELCAPLGDDWQALDDVHQALARAARHFTGQERFFGILATGNPTTSAPPPLPRPEPPA